MPIAPRMNQPVGPYDFWRDTLQPGLLGLRTALQQGLLNPLQMAAAPAARYGLLAEGDTKTRQQTLDSIAMSPGLFGDVIGPIADAYRFGTDPESRTWENAGFAALGALPFVPAVGSMVRNADALPMDEASRMVHPSSMTTYFSGTYGKPATEIVPYGEIRPDGGENFFGGLFATTDADVALSHGANLQKIDVPDELVADFDDLRHMLLYSDNPSDQVIEIIKKSRGIDITPDEAYELADYMARDKSIWSDAPDMGMSRLEDITGQTELANIDWALQGMSGEIARTNGYAAVWLPDEHGESLLVLSHPDVKMGR